jgi:hypothetical protein
LVRLTADLALVPWKTMAMGALVKRALEVW